jgi:hypothetical protein
MWESFKSAKIPVVSKFLISKFTDCEKHIKNRYLNFPKTEQFVLGCSGGGVIAYGTSFEEL